jgi:hypothetical protein
VTAARHELGAVIICAAQKRCPWHYAISGVKDNNNTTDYSMLGDNPTMVTMVKLKIAGIIAVINNDSANTKESDVVKI